MSLTMLSEGNTNYTSLPYVVQPFSNLYHSPLSWHDLQIFNYIQNKGHLRKLHLQASLTVNIENNHCGE